MPPERLITQYVAKNPENLRKMLFVTGPRQVGKTTLLQSWPKALNLPRSFYLNWDVPEDRKILRSNSLAYFQEHAATDASRPFFLLDEIHKYPRWKNFLKGLYDHLKDRAYFAITGSARLDTYRRGGDSLMGRYWLFHLYPFSVAELAGNTSLTVPSTWPDANRPEWREHYDALFQLGGFPEPLFSGEVTTHRRWSMLRKEILIREDLRDLSRILELAAVEHLLDLLPQRVGSPLSINALREDLEVSHHTMQNWLRWLEALYYIFFLPVYSRRIARSLKKERKMYLYDWADIADPGARFENLVALHLLKAVQGYRELLGEDLRLTYLRDKEKREADFCILKNGKPWMIVEAKVSPDTAPTHLAYFAQTLGVEHVIQLTHDWVDPQWKVFRNCRYWLSPAGTFFANWL